MNLIQIRAIHIGVLCIFIIFFSGRACGQKNIGLSQVDSIRIDSTLRNVGRLLSQGKTELATTLFESLQAKEKGKIDYFSNKLSGDWYHIKGGVYKEKGDFKRTLSCWKSALFFREQGSDKMSLAKTYNNVAAAYSLFEDFETSLYYLEKALQIRIEINFALDYGYRNIGFLYLEMGDYSRAEEYFEKGLKYTLESDNPSNRMLASSYSSFGHLYKVRGQLNESLQAYKSALIFLALRLKLWVKGKK